MLLGVDYKRAVRSIFVPSRRKFRLENIWKPKKSTYILCNWSHYFFPTLAWALIGLHFIVHRNLLIGLFLDRRVLLTPILGMITNGAIENVQSKKHNALKNYTPEEYSDLIRVAVSSATENGTVLVTCTNKAYLDLFYNQIASMDRLSPKLSQMFVVFADDNEAYIHLKKHFSNQRVIPPQNDNDGFKTGHKQFSKDFNNLNSRRPERLLEVLHRNVTLMYVDADMVWVKDPLHALHHTHKQNNLDIILMNDSPVFSKTYNENHQASIMPLLHFFCSCFIYLQPTARSEKFLENWIGFMLLVDRDMNDEGAMNQALRSTQKNFQINFGVVPSHQFPNGLLYFSHYEEYKDIFHDVYVVHPNYVFTVEDKHKNLTAKGLWYLNQMSNSSDNIPASADNHNETTF